MSKNNLTRLYEDYPLCFGDGLELGDDISRISEEEKSRNCEPKKRPKMKKSTLPVEVSHFNNENFYNCFLSIVLCSLLIF